MSHQLFIDFYLYNFAEIALVLYLLAYILYAVVFGGSSTFSHPTLLKSTIVFTKILLLCILLAFGNTGSDYIFNGGSNSNIFSFVFRIILLLSSIALLCISRDYLSSRMIVKYEYDLLILFSIISLIILSNSDDFLIVYLAIELQSLAFYALATFQRHSEFSTETGLKYFILGALSSGLLLFGFALIYVAFGVTSFEALSKLFSTSDGVLAFWGLLFILAAFFFKLGAAPFHMWLCDVYEGSLTTVTAFFAAVPKIILWGLLLRLCSTIFYGCTEYLSILLVIAGLISVCFASVAALYQKRVKRLLAYSTISHTGFILLGISCGSIDSIKSCFIYIALYSLMSLLTFSIIIYTSLNNKIPKYLIN
jgi:NADH-quinone oxidoreductase subunit N